MQSWRAARGRHVSDKTEQSTWRRTIIVKYRRHAFDPSFSRLIVVPSQSNLSHALYSSNIDTKSLAIDCVGNRVSTKSN